MRHVLVVANKTLGGEELLRVVLEKASAEPTDFWLVVPATHLPSGRPDSMMDWAKGMPLEPGALVSPIATRPRTTRRETDFVSGSRG
ncbi:MAG: hypothetical protein ABR593_12050 [Candidatus Limnocylindria bacterium]